MEHFWYLPSKHWNSFPFGCHVIYPHKICYDWWRIFIVLNLIGDCILLWSKPQNSIACYQTLVQGMGTRLLSYMLITPTHNVLLCSEVQLSISLVVCYCSVGYRSSLVAQRLYRHYKEQEKTCPPLHNLEGGLFQWANEGRPLAISNTVHPYSSAWGKLLDSKLRAQM